MARKQRSTTVVSAVDSKAVSTVAPTAASTVVNSAIAADPVLAAVLDVQGAFLREADSKRRFEQALNHFLELTGSTYGFIGEIVSHPGQEPYLKTFAISNIAWDEPTRAYYEQNAPAGMEFRNLETLFGSAIRTGQPVIANQPQHDPRAGGIPSGHPSLDAFLAIPFDHDGHVVGMVGLANRPGGYEENQIEKLAPLCQTCALLTLADRNERRRQEAEKSLREDNARFLQISEVLNNIAWSMVLHPDDQLEVEWLKGDMAKLLDYEAQELAGMAWLNVVHPDDQKILSSSFQQLREGKNYVSEYRLINRRGDIHWVRGTATPVEFLSGGVSLRALGTAVDITERKRVELELLRQRQELQAIFDAVHAQVMYLDDEARVLRHNAYSQKVTGLDDEQMRGQTILTVAPNWDDPQLRHQQSLEVLRTGQPLLGSIETFSDGGQTRWARVDKVPIRDELNQVSGLLLFIYDITESHLAAERLTQQRDELAHVSRLSTMGQMAASMIHEIAQPISAIRNFATAALNLGRPKPAGADKREEFLHNIVRQTERATLIMDRMRVFGRKTAPQHAPCDVGSLIEEAADLVASELRRQGVRCRVELPAEKLQIAADRVQLQQVLVNLLKNAGESQAQTAGARKTIWLRAAAQGPSVVIEVEDRGAGIPPEVLSKLFEPFVSTKKKGMGIGLAICKSIIEAHQGTIEALNKPRGGAVFRVTLPLEAYDAAPSNDG